jgi:hypothetical protein
VLKRRFQREGQAVEDGGVQATGHVGGRGGAASVPLRALVDTIERRLRERGIGATPDAFLLGRERHAIIDAVRRGLLDFVAVVDWTTFHRLSPLLARRGLDGVHAAVALSLAPALVSGVTTEVLNTLDCAGRPRPLSVLFGRLTRATGGHVVFRSQLLQLAEGECGITPLEMTGWLERHTATAIRAMLHGRLIKRRADLTSEQRQMLIDQSTRHLGRLLPEAETYQHSVRVLRLAYYRLHYPATARPVLRRLRIIDFGMRRASATGRARPRG